MKPFLFYMSDEDKERLERIAQEQDLSMSQVCRKALKEYFDKQKGERDGREAQDSPPQDGDIIPDGEDGSG